MAGLIQDLRLTARLLLKSPGFTVAVVLTLGLGIGANTAIFTILDGLYQRMMPYEESERLVTPAESFGDGMLNITSFERPHRKCRFYQGIPLRQGHPLSHLGSNVDSQAKCSVSKSRSSTVKRRTAHSLA